MFLLFFRGRFVEVPQSQTDSNQLASLSNNSLKDLTHEIYLFVVELSVCLCVQSTGKTQQKDVFNLKWHMSVTLL